MDAPALIRIYLMKPAGASFILIKKIISIKKLQLKYNGCIMLVLHM